MVSESFFITILRHGESVGNLEGRFQGHADFPLTDKGRLQVQALAERWREDGITFDACISSPLLRARQTAEIICSALNIPIEFDPDWMEINNGMLAGLTHEEGRERVPEPDPQAETHPRKLEQGIQLLPFATANKFSELNYNTIKILSFFHQTTKSYILHL